MRTPVPFRTAFPLLAVLFATAFGVLMLRRRHHFPRKPSYSISFPAKPVVR
jgi:hypothetical protein